MNVAILGGGITGLTAAYRLSRAGHTVRVFEAGPRLGGPLRTEQTEGWLVEAGPNTFQQASSEITTLIEEIGLGAVKIHTAPEAKNRYIAKDGKLVALPSPSTAKEMISTPLFSLGTKMRIMKEVTHSPRLRTEDVSVAALVREHFGAEVLERIVQPFIGGIFAGDAERLSMRHAFPMVWEMERTSGSLVRGGMAAAQKRKELGAAGATPLISFKGGLQALPDALAAGLPTDSVELGADVRALKPASGGKWTVQWESAGGSRTAAFDCVMAALPGLSLAKLQIGRGGKSPLAGLGEIEYPPVASVFLGYKRDRITHPLDGFGALVPAAEKRSVLGIIFSSSLFPGRAPEKHVGLTSFVGGSLQPELALLPKTELMERVAKDLGALVGASGKPAFARHTLWKRAIPQYNLGYGRHLEAIADCEKANPGLFFGGNVRDGISIPDCLKSGAALAKRAS